MAQLNSITVVPRHNRPSTEERVELQMHYIVGGSLSDPYEIQNVHIFKDVAASSLEFPYITNGLPESLLDLNASSTTYGQLATSALDNSIFRYSWGSSVDISSSSFDNSGYSLDSSAASGIYRADNYTAGVFSVVLAPNISGTESDATSRVIAASGLGAGNYFDIWTVRHTSTGNLRTFINKFTLSEDSVIVATEPYIIEPTIRLKNRYVEIGSIEDIHFTVKYGVGNPSLSNAEKNIFRDSIVRDAKVRITKLNEDPSMATRYEVSGFSDTSGLVRVTSNDDVLFQFDTTVLTTIANANENYGTVRGVYEVVLEIVLITETIRSPRFKIVLR